MLVLEDGTVFTGSAIGANGTSVGELVFNTSMTGYQEILTDPSYSHQIVTLTYPHIGNTGTNKEDVESTKIHAQGLIIRDLPIHASNFRNQQPLDCYLKENNIVAIADIDTRKLTRILRNKGALSACIIATDETKNIDKKNIAAKALLLAQNFCGLKGLDLAKEVTTKESYLWSDTCWQLAKEKTNIENADTNSTDINSADIHDSDIKKSDIKKSDIKKINNPFFVIAYDFGVKHNILRMLVDRGCKVKVVPATTTAKDVMAMNPDGIFLSNGPGDPEPCNYAIEAIKTLLTTNIPLFGICLGHQLLALANGAKTIKMKFGHHGANHPVEDIEKGTVMITSQNHGFAVDESSLPSNIKATHRSLFDNSLQGIHLIDKPAFSFQGHPEASPGPHDSAALFDHFIELISLYKNASLSNINQ